MVAMSIPEMDVASKADRATGSAKALVKGLAIIDVVAARGPLRLGEIVTASGLPRPTALRLIDALLEHRVLRFDDASGYGLGSQVLSWGQHYLDGLDLREHAQDLLDELSASARETCFLGVPDGGRVLYVGLAHGPQAVRPSARLGTRNPLHCTGIGKAILAWASDDVVDAALTGTLVAKTPRTLTDAETIRAELQRTRERGYAIDDIENEDGVRCVAAPVRDHRGEVVAGLSVSAPAYRFDHDDLAQLAPRVVATADELSARIGYRGRPRPGTEADPKETT